MSVNTTVTLVNICWSKHFLRRKRSSELYELYDNQTIYTRSKRYVEEPKFDVFLNPSKKSQQEETLKNLTKKFQQVFRSMDMKQSYPALFQVLAKNIFVKKCKYFCYLLSPGALAFGQSLLRHPELDLVLPRPEVHH